jgi:hypothetical protein
VINKRYFEGCHVLSGMLQKKTSFGRIYQHSTTHWERRSYGISLSVNSLPAFRDNLSVLDFMTLEDGTGAFWITWPLKMGPVRFGLHDPWRWDRYVLDYMTLEDGTGTFWITWPLKVGPVRFGLHDPWSWDRYALDYMTLEDGTRTFSWNVSKELPLYAAWCPRRAQISTRMRRMPEITHGHITVCSRRRRFS